MAEELRPAAVITAKPIPKVPKKLLVRAFRFETAPGIYLFTFIIYIDMAHASFSSLIKGDIPTLVDFHADWCGPCKMMKPILEELKGQVGDRAKIIKIDVDRNPAIANQFQVRGVPTLALFKNGELKWRQSGVVQVASLRKVIEQYASTPA